MESEAIGQEAVYLEAARIRCYLLVPLPVPGAILASGNRPLYTLQKFYSHEFGTRK